MRDLSRMRQCAISRASGTRSLARGAMRDLSRSATDEALPGKYGGEAFYIKGLARPLYIELW